MNKSVFELLGGKSKQPQNPMVSMIQAFGQFKSSFQGNAQQEVMRLVKEGKISQSELNELQNMASQLQRLLK